MGKKTKPSGDEHQRLNEGETDYRPMNWKKIFLTPKYIPWHILLIVIAVITVLITVYHDKVVEILRPFSEKVRDLPAGWLIPIVILVVISFPPLFGHEIIGLLCGVVYGLWIGFAIVAAGTFIGEIGTWFAFMKVFRKKAEKLERTNLNYAALARLTRDGGFWIVFVIRFSIIPSHFSTAVFSTCDVKFWHFAVATFLTLPKQIFIVYLGVLLVNQQDNNKIQTIVLCATFGVTLVMGAWIWFKLAKYKKILMEEQQQSRDIRMEQLRLAEEGHETTSTLMPKITREESRFTNATPYGSTTDLGSQPTQWDPMTTNSGGLGYAPAPTPTRYYETADGRQENLGYERSYNGSYRPHRQEYQGAQQGNYQAYPGSQQRAGQGYGQGYEQGNYI